MPTDPVHECLLENSNPSTAKKTAVVVHGRDVSNGWRKASLKASRLPTCWIAAI